MGDNQQTENGAKALIDEMVLVQQRIASAQARQADLMMKFSDARRHLDQRRINRQHSGGGDPRHKAGEFAAMEIGLAIRASKHTVCRTLGIARRVREETPDAWDAWTAGHIDHDRARRINKALLRLTKKSSKQMLNAMVVDVAICKTPELLGRWLNEFVSRIESDETDERLHRAIADRCVNIRPDLDGISFLHAALSAADAEAIDSSQCPCRRCRTRRYPHPSTTPCRRVRRTSPGQGQQRMPRPLGRGPGRGPRRRSRRRGP